MGSAFVRIHKFISCGRKKKEYDSNGNVEKTSRDLCSFRVFEKRVTNEMTIATTAAIVIAMFQEKYIKLAMLA
jgi:hypothetical protein